MLRKLCAKICCAQADSDEEAHHAHLRPIDSAGRDEVELGTQTSSTASRNTGLKDLWEEAFNKLDPESRRWLSTDNPSSTTDAIHQVIKETKDKYSKYKNRGLTIRKRDGGEIKVREIAENILTWALQAQDVVKAVVAFDPSGHASNAWAIVSLGLTMISNDIERRDAIFEASEYLAGKLAYFSIIDSEYRYQGTKGSQGLEEALVDVYTAILKYSAEVKRKYHESTAARIGNALISLTEQPLQKLKTTVESKGQEVVQWANLNDNSHNEVQARSILAAIDKAAEEVRKNQAMIFNAEEERILDWLCTATYSDIHNSAQKCRTSETGNWFLESTDYHLWTASPGRIFWLHGAAGCGKSVLCSTTIEDIIQICRDDQGKQYAYWYFKFDDLQTLRVENMVRSVIRQICPIPLPEVIRRVWEDHSRKGSQPNPKAPLDVLHRVLAGLDGEVFLILDALDECPESPDRSERSFLLSFLVNLQKQQSNLHILVTSRPEPDIRTQLKGYMALDLEKKLEKDVEAFVRLRASTGKLQVFGQELTTMIIDELLQVPERRFRWADLQIKRLKDCHTKDQIEEALKTIPPTLESTYHDVLEKVQPKDRDTVRSILIWLSFSTRPLTIKEVASAVSLLVPDHAVNICTTYFVTLRKSYHSDDYIRLAHFSVKEFLVSQDSTYASHWCQFSSFAGHRLIAEKAISSLLNQTEPVTTKTTIDQPILTYSAERWPKHVKALEPKLHECPDLQENIDQLFCHPTIYYNWQRLSGIDNYELLPPIGTVSRLGFKHAAKALLARGVDPLKMFVGNSRTTNAVLIAAQNDHLDVLDCLLENNPVTADLTRRILTVVQHEGSGVRSLEKVLDRLLDLGVMFSGGNTEQHHTIDERMIVAAAENRSSGLGLMTIFLDRFEREGRATVPITDGIVARVIRNMQAGKHILRLLFNTHNADVRVTSEIVDSLMDSSRTSLLTVELFVRKRAADFHVDEASMGRLAERGSQKTMELLLEARRDDIQVTENVLVAACCNPRDPGVLRVLLGRRQPGVNVSERLLGAAVGNWHSGLEIIQVLLDECGPDFALGEDVLLKVASNNRLGLDMVRLLLRRQQAGLVVSTAVLAAAAGNIKSGREILELLMSNGGSGLEITEDMLMAAARNTFQPTLEYLLELEEQSQGRGLPITAKVLNHVVRYRDVECVETVLRRHPDTPVQEEATTPRYLTHYGHDEADSHNGDKGGEVLDLLLDRQLLEVNEQVVETVAGNSSALKILYSRNPKFPITQQAAVRAAEDPVARRFLLDTRIDDIPISEEVMIAVAREGHTISADMQRILAHFGQKVPITENLLAAAASHYNNIPILQLLLPDSNPAIPISEKIVIIATYYYFPVLRWLLEERGSAVRLTEKLAVAAAGKGPNALLWLIQEQHINPQQLWKAAWQSDPGDDRFYYHLRREAARHILEYTEAVDVSESTFEGASTIRNDRGDSAFDDLIHCSLKHKLPIPTSESMMAMVLERSSTKVITYFLKDGPKIPIMEKHIQALGKNPMLDDKQRGELMPLLAARMHIE
ncbi:hypothetical protein BO78DRAFT_413007 [Aspergillus sclerotiicarbonarius CBS 121057]|uniref:NACHT domain-containing protein n=1 Tax=Aspergillus sclerotiicarbonarius (strain CBS 121057 / IBT 28362) TaxID=1448318 RepID=A0A319FNI4_ASPSB|nr:hypothetical protein BO78DRAFT_413007 [Aspergillus sclerotiicarbonarius CBS 121057]